MKSQESFQAVTSARPKKTKGLSLMARLVLSRLERVDRGELTVHVGDTRFDMGCATDDGLRAEIRVHNEAFWGAVARRGSVGAGEAFAKGWWTSEEPTNVVRLFIRNQDSLAGLEGGLARISRPLLAAYHSLRRNTERGSRENISAHYDLSNDFFALFLDDTMTYSCGFYEHENSTLKEASIAKIDRLCHKLDLRPSDHLLEIGTGWGALSMHAAREYGCRVTTTTISREQHDMAAERIRAAGLEDRIELLLQDYRRLEGRYDKLVSVEMIEAVGHQFYGKFFEQCAALLKPDGVMALQAITIADQYFDQASRSVDFIKRHIFPGSCIPSVTALCSSMTKASDLRLTDIEDIGPHYVKTLATWRANLRDRWSEARALGHSEDFLRLWEFYFCYCEGGFAERHISDVHMLLAKPGSRPGREVRTA